MMTSTTSPSLPSVIREILDRIGSEDLCSLTETHSLSLPGPATAESIALEHSLRSLIARFQNLERRSIHACQVNNRLVSKQQQNLKETSDKYEKVLMCSACGHLLDLLPSTPEETPTSYSIAPHIPMRIAMSSFMLTAVLI